MTLSEYHQLHAVPVAGGSLYVKAGARGFPNPQYELLAKALKASGETALDLNPGVGLVTHALQRSGLKTQAIETSWAAFRCLKASFADQGVGLAVGLPWETEPASADVVALVLPANRGTRYVELSLWGAANALRLGGRLWIAGSKEKGFERYFREAQALVGFGVLQERQGQYRVALLEKEKSTPPLGPVWEHFEATILGQQFRFEHLPGVFSAGHLDPGTRMLLEALPPDPSNLGDVLDIGGGYGGLSLPLLERASSVTLLEDDWVSVLSARASLAANYPAGANFSVLHSDVDAALTKSASFTTVVSNPPFHVGGVVVLETARAFLETAYARLNSRVATDAKRREGGRFYLVANRFLPYEPLLAERFASVRTLSTGSHKVLLAQK